MSQNEENKRVEFAVKQLLKGSTTNEYLKQLEDWQNTFLNDDITNDKKTRQDSLAIYTYFKDFFKAIEKLN